MIAYNCGTYFLNDVETQDKWIREFIDLCKELNVIYIGENTGGQTEFLLKNFVRNYWGYEL